MSFYRLVDCAVAKPSWCPLLHRAPGTSCFGAFMFGALTSGLHPEEYMAAQCQETEIICVCSTLSRRECHPLSARWCTSLHSLPTRLQQRRPRVRFAFRPLARATC
jgi:hypothetical protein